jgi:hypothetical protein
MLPEKIQQLKGAQYAIVANYPNGPKHGAGRGLAHWSGQTGNKYQDGNLFTGTGDSWFVSSVDDYDVFFRTYVKQ